VNVLALDAAYGQASACLLAGTVVHGETLSDPTPHSQAMLPLLARLLAAASLDWDRIDVLALGIGPGSFTGIRVAAATVAGLNAVLARPVLPISSLAVTACQAGVEGPVWVLEDARAGEMFAACYQGMEAVEDDACHAYAGLASWSPAPYVSHRPPPGCEGWPRLALSLDRAEALATVVAHRLRRVPDIAALPRTASPAYLQRSQAERNADHA
jgi:tRNA threonylcarbamoyl adenosine modification protein YeaZ